MDHREPIRTSASLLGRLRQGGDDPDDWSAFVRTYGPLIYGWCRRWKLQEADAQDVTQDVLARLAARLRTFQYDSEKSFRAYVKTMAHYAWADLLEARKRPGAGGSGDTAVLDQLGPRIVKTEYTTSAVAADAIAARRLDVALGVPLLRTRAVLSDSHGQVHTVIESLNRPDRFGIRAALERNPSRGANSQWRLKRR